MSTERSRGRVLIVEDDRGLLELYADVLLEEGYEAACAMSGAAALRALATNPFDVVLTDVVMPDCSGVEVLRAVRDRDLDVPVVLVTGSPSVETAVQALELGAVHYLVKPVMRAELLRCVSHAARLRRLATAKREAVRYLGSRDSQTADPAEDEASFGQALKAMYMAYQPIVRTRDGSVFAWEALLRTREPKVAGPPAFLDLAERLGRLQDLGRAIRDTVACAAVRSRGVMFFVNLHPDDLLDERLYDESAPLSSCAHEIVLEITERSSIEQVPDIRRRVSRLRALGFRLAVDDLGSGYAGLSSFASLEPDFVKLDRALVAGIDGEPTRRKLVASIVAVSCEMGIPVVAEGIERPEERDTVSALGCDLLQGYLFGRPGSGPQAARPDEPGKPGDQGGGDRRCVAIVEAGR